MFRSQKEHFQKCVCADTIKSSFRATGTWPVNRFNVDHDLFNPSEVYTEASSNNNGTENVDEETDVTSTANVVPEYNAAGDAVTVIGVNNERLVSLANYSNNAAENLSTVPSIEFTVHEDSTHISTNISTAVDLDIITVWEVIIVQIRPLAQSNIGTMCNPAEEHPFC